MVQTVSDLVTACSIRHSFSEATVLQYRLFQTLQGALFHVLQNLQVGDRLSGVVILHLVILVGSVGDPPGFNQRSSWVQSAILRGSVDDPLGFSQSLVEEGSGTASKLDRDHQFSWP